VKPSSIALGLALAGTPLAALAGHGPPPPIIGSVAPASGPARGGTPITVTGSDFQPGATLTLGNVEARDVVVVSSSTLRAITVPHAPGAVSVSVTNRDGRGGTRGLAFTYLAGPEGRVPGPSPIGR
jgi:large repetitive protein